MEITIENILESAKQALGVLDTFAAVPLPVSLREAVQGKWLSSGINIGESLLGQMDEAEVKKFGTRVMKIEVANELFVQFEQDLVESYTSPLHSPLYLALKRMGTLPKFILKNIAVLCGIVIPAITFTLESIVDYFNDIQARAVIGGIMNFQDNRTEGYATNAAEYEKLTARIKADELAIDAGVLAIAAIAAYYTYSKFVAVAASARAYKLKMQSVQSLRDSLVEKFRHENSVAFVGVLPSFGFGIMLPQRKRKSYRRRKRARS